MKLKLANVKKKQIIKIKSKRTSLNKQFCEAEAQDETIKWLNRVSRADMLK